MSTQWSETLSFEGRHTLSPPSPEPPEPRTHTWSQPPLKNLTPGQSMSLAGISLRAFALGLTTSLGLVSTVLILTLTSSPLWRIPFFLCALSTFHFLEFWTTAAANTPEATVHSFLLTANWPAYPVAHTVACVECVLTKVVFPGRSWAPLGLGTALMLTGLVMVVGGQVVRSAAMLTAGQSFNHTVQTRKADSHTLVTTGVYGLWRHPSYFGFFYWGLGTQLVLGNVFCFVGYAYVLWKFFSSRVRVEERGLVKFFGDDYVQYRRRVGTMIPFVG
ncbi:farnesyl cysteine-carboxyl methyltransferase [Metarhizium acridum]|uniref:farnesyl cysteine-carboxyl methyltransferase n=1 Tax=Metarhizium acridum TaxID=92637 RepID=UPI001C6CFCCE|nr:farnesyl cysteine-carboxyl methyltransferase [Metarhizium acridum]